MPPQTDPFAQFPQYPLNLGGTGGHIPPGSPPPQGEELPERIPYQAPPRQRSLMVYLYIGLAILVMILGVMGITQLLNNQEARTAIVTISEQGSAYSGNALIVRDETVFMQEGVTDITYLAGENDVVMRGDAVCTVYTTGFSSREFSQLQTYRKQIKEYLKILRSESDSPDTRLQLLENTIFDRAIETRALVQGMNGNLLTQESLLMEAIASRYDYLKQKYPDDTKLTRLYDNEKTQMQRIDTWTKQYTAADNGIVSFYTDGLELPLNLKTYENYNPQEVRSMYNGRIPANFERPRDSTDIYRLVRPYEWAVLMLADDLKWNPAIGDTYQIMIESFDNTTVEGKVSSVTRSGGDLLVRLSVSSPVEPVLNIRACHVQLSTSIITYAVPNSAIVSKGGIMGVVVQFREGLFIVPVNIVSQDATQTYVIPQNPGHLYEGLSVQLNPQQQAQRQQQQQQEQQQQNP
ncbi:MAG: hypothetical protein GX858_01330 [Clostridiales bacterium]|nr:hypothetical protein [Clostridiales bacterium]